MATCLFHTDADGALSAMVVQKAIPNVQLVPINYGWGIPWSKLTPGEPLYIVDFCFDPEDMRELVQKFPVCWIDHHVTALEAMKEVNVVVPNGRQDITKAGCVLTWEHLFPNKPLPKAIQLIGTYDIGEVFTNPNMDPALIADIMALNVALTQSDEFAMPHLPGKLEAWQKLIQSDDYTNQVIEKGRPIHNYITASVAAMNRYMVFETMFHGHVALAANVANVDPSTFFHDSVNPKRHALTITFYYHKKGYWKFSIRRVEGHESKVDVAAIAQEHGGGGHAAAAGFVAMPKDFPLVLEPTTCV